MMATDDMTLKSYVNPVGQPIKWSNPMQSYTSAQHAVDVAERQVCVRSFAVASGNPSISAITLDEVVSNPVVAKAFALYKRFTFDTIEFTLSWASTPFDYGRVIISERPSWETGTYRPMSHPHAWSSVSSIDACVFERPFRNRHRWVANTGQFYDMKWPLVMQHGLRSTAEDLPTCTLTISARLKGVKFFQPLLQSGPRRVSRPTHREQQVRSERGLLSSIAETVTTVADAATVLPGVGPYAQTASTLARAVGDVATKFGLQKPVSAAAPVSSVLYKVDPALGQPRGLFTGPKHSLSIESSASMDTVIMADDKDYSDLGTLFQLPGELIDHGHISGTAGERLRSIPVRPTYSRDATLLPRNFVQWGANMAKYWAGSLDYTFVISAPSSATVKLLFSLDDGDGSTSGSTPAERIGTVPTYEITVNGDTEFTLRIPYTGATRRLLTGVADVPTLQMWQMSRVQTSGFTGSVALHYSVYISAGPDFRLWVARDRISRFMAADNEWTVVRQFEPRKGLDPILMPGTQIVVDNDTEFGEMLINWRDFALRPKGYYASPADPVRLSYQTAQLHAANHPACIPFAFIRSGIRVYDAIPHAPIMDGHMISVVFETSNGDEITNYLPLTDSGRLTCEFPYAGLQSYVNTNGPREDDTYDAPDSVLVTAQNVEPGVSGVILSFTDDALVGFPRIN